MEVLAIIPARGNSIEIKNKNLQKIGGIPLVGNTIEIAKRSKLISKVVVSSDSDNILNVAIKFGAEIIKRPNNISGGNSKSEKAILHSINFLIKTQNYLPDYVVFLQCTSPLIDEKDIDGILEKTFRTNSDSAFTVTNFHKFIWEYKKGKLVAVNYDPNNRAMRQERGREYLEVGAIYVFKTEGFLKSKNRIYGKTEHYLLDEYKSIEIDSLIDLELCRLLYKKFHSNNIRIKKQLIGNVNKK